MGRALQLLMVVLAPVAVFAAMIGADRAFGALSGGHDYVQRIELPPDDAGIGLPPVAGPLDASRPLVVIDAGHGGHDPGAGTPALYEKEVTLRLAQALRDKLLADGGIRVAMTRNDDRFLMLPERYEIARKLKADLFISIHADSAENSSATGATVYTLSDKGSSEVASRMAERENSSDTINGISLDGKSNALEAILVDLSQRETQVKSDEFARLIVREGQGRLAFRPVPTGSAAFIVLKSPDVPSVLFESGYISNANDAARLASDTGRQTFADVTARAMRVYFARRSTD